MLRIIYASSDAHLENIRDIFNEYANSLGLELDFQDFENELAYLPGDYAPPEGRLLLALFRDLIAGSVALRKLGDGICEMKRLYVRPQFRGLGIGKADDRHCQLVQ